MPDKGTKISCRIIPIERIYTIPVKFDEATSE
jgi:hypothetical protein